MALSKDPIIMEDLELMKFYQCQQRGTISFKVSSIVDLPYNNADIFISKKKTRLNVKYYNHNLLKYKIYKSIFFKMFSTLFSEKKVNFSRLKALSLIIIEKTLVEQKRLATKLSVKQEDYDELKEEIFLNLDNILNLFLDSDLENSINHCFKEKIYMAPYLKNRISEMTNPYIVENLPKVSLDKLEETKSYMGYYILSLNKVGDNLADIVLTSPFEINEGMKQKYFWISNLFHYFNKYFKDKDKKYNKYFLDNWFAINSVIVYNPLNMKREVYYAKHFDQSFPEVELLKILSIIENKLQIKNFYGGNCDYCESRLFCSVYAFNYPAQSKVMKEKQDFYKETKIII